MPITYVGRVTNFKGKTMWEILGNLKNFGVGRILVRSTFERYPEPSYLKVVKVETLPGDNLKTPDELRKVRAWVEKTFRGNKSPKLVEICSTSYKPDYRLLHKTEEEAYCKCDTPYSPKTILEPEFKFPPLLQELILRDRQLKNENTSDELKLKMKYKFGRENRAKLSSENEIPNVKLSLDLGKPVSPNLYKNV